MMTPEALLDGYLDLNLLFFAGTVLWILARRLLAQTSFGSAFQPQLRTLNVLTLLFPFSPLLVLAITQYVVMHPPNISDLMVAQYLQGNVGMSAGKFETLLGLREDLLRNLIAQQSFLAQALAVAFGLGIAISLGSTLMAILHLRRILQGAFHWKRFGRVQLLVSDRVLVAFSTRSLWTRYVVVPTGLLDRPSDLRMTIAHEVQHLRQRDIECEFLLEALRPFLFWNPAYYLWRNEIRTVREFACDQVVLQRKGLNARKYCECLIRACAAAVQRPAFFYQRCPGVPLLNRQELRSKSVLERRICAVTRPLPQNTLPLLWTGVCVSLMIAILFFAVLLQRPADWSHDRIMLSTIVNLERMASRKQTENAPASGLYGSFVSEY